MKKNPGFIYRLIVMLGDAMAFFASFTYAYYFRTHIDSRPYYFESETREFALTMICLIPFWIILLAFFGLYKKKVFTQKSRYNEIGKLFIASLIGVMMLISYDFIYQHNLFPVRIIAATAAVLCFAALLVERTIIRWIRAAILKRNYGALRAIVVGNSKNTDSLVSQMSAFPEHGYQVVGIVANNKFIPSGYKKFKYSSLKEALKKTQPDVIFQTDEANTAYVYGQAIKYHSIYYFVPSESALSSQFGSVELIGDTPAMQVRVTPLVGGARFVKRAMDIVISLLALIVAVIPMVIIWIAEKIMDPKSPAVYSEIRLSRYNKKFKIYKFRSMKMEYSGMSPEDAFVKMGKPQLIKKYRKNGDFLKDDPRITSLGRFIRATSLDELPQLFNVLKGDISFVGPRALVPGELKNYGNRSLILSVKSGLTGLAQVSGRRDISFEERRALDIYYVQNWSVWMDIQIILRTITVVFTHKGAK